MTTQNSNGTLLSKQTNSHYNLDWNSVHATKVHLGTKFIVVDILLKTIKTTTKGYTGSIEVNQLEDYKTIQEEYRSL